MRCYLVLVHGVFDYHVRPLPSGLHANGFYAGRSVIARDEEEAKERAFRTVQKGLADWNADLRDGLVTARLSAEDIYPVPIWHLFRRANRRGHVFYAD